MTDSKKRFVVHVYYVNAGVEDRDFADPDAAKGFADSSFKKKSVYKVKVWDLEQGSIDPNNPNAQALVYELV